ncbi:hypothetical protein PHYBOEH_003540 [Phytophthora boehmeriae]|uniref:RxLR effector protein n=1 Tax=Phytophthora boehmeriae TaxID=109152 RepID=A0A8T1X9A4_9STRA|nr:hypothetical protein PHYBOEH_003540 [Phytophthora boehmeriae]
MRVSYLSWAAVFLLLAFCAPASAASDSKGIITSAVGATQNDNAGQRFLRTASSDNEERIWERVRGLVKMKKVKDNFTYKRLSDMLTDERYMINKFGEWKKAGFDAKSINSKIDLERHPHFKTLVTQFENYLNPGKPFGAWRRAMINLSHEEEEFLFLMLILMQQEQEEEGEEEEEEEEELQQLQPQQQRLSGCHQGQQDQGGRQTQQQNDRYERRRRSTSSSRALVTPQVAQQRHQTAPRSR